MMRPLFIVTYLMIGTVVGLSLVRKGTNDPAPVWFCVITTFVWPVVLLGAFLGMRRDQQ